jgi:hypothetical protein
MTAAILLTGFLCGHIARADMACRLAHFQETAHD